GPAEPVAGVVVVLGVAGEGTGQGVRPAPGHLPRSTYLVRGGGGGGQGGGGGAGAGLVLAGAVVGDGRPVGGGGVQGGLRISSALARAVRGTAWGPRAGGDQVKQPAGQVGRTTGVESAGGGAGCGDAVAGDWAGEDLHAGVLPVAEPDGGAEQGAEGVG